MPMTQPVGTERAGDVKYHAANAIPPGWLKANGAAISRTAYAALFAVIGTTYGVGDGSTTFNLPDLRGEFVRGLDDGRGVDSGRTIGTAQADETRQHNHGVAAGTGYMNTGGTANIASGAAHAFVTSTTSSLSGGVETRPRNVAMLACIKY